jgi:hypothetical protein
MPDNGLYTLKVKGEKNTYEFRGSEQHGIGPLCDMLSDLTGYLAVYLRRSVVGPLKINEEAQVQPAVSGGFGGAPQFLVKRVG